MSLILEFLQKVKNCFLIGYSGKSEKNGHKMDILEGDHES